MKILKWFLSKFEKKQQVLEQNLRGYPHYLREVIGDNGIILKFVNVCDFSMYLYNPHQKYFYTILGDTVYFPKKSGCKKLNFK